MELIITSIVAFASTNIDDVFLLMLFFSDKRFRSRDIVIGQFLGISTLIAISFVVSYIGLIIGEAYIGLLGFMPIYLGIKGVIGLFRKEENEESLPDTESKKNRVLAVAAVTIANGGDNLGIYIPLFAPLLWTEKTIMISIFFLMTALWCILASYFTRHPMLATLTEKYGHRITPFVLILLGLFILYKSNSISLVL